LDKKRLCRDCERRKLESAERKLVESWSCLFLENMFCPCPSIPAKKRFFSRIDRLVAGLPFFFLYRAVCISTALGSLGSALCARILRFFS
jgi:hypothetical protein